VKKSYLWDNVVVKHLQTNMRVHLFGDQVAGQFADQLLAIGDNRFPNDDNSIDIVQLPETMGMFMSSIDELMSRLIVCIYEHQMVVGAVYFSSLNQNHSLYQYISGRAVTW